MTGYRKLTTAVTIAGQWFDFSYAAGNPVANYYASVPLTSATVDADRGIYHGPNVAPARSTSTAPCWSTPPPARRPRPRRT